MRIEKKVWPEFFEKVLSGEKTFELRLADWDCQPGDILILKEWDPKLKQCTGRQIEKIVTYRIRTKDLKFFPQEDVEKYGWQAIGFK